MTNRVEKITIVGGGTAGWLAAMVIATYANKFRNGTPLKVSLIESPKIPTVGVGESTVAGMPFLMQQLGIDEAELIRRCNASFKLNVRFGGWRVDANGNPENFNHPLQYPTNLGGYAPAYHFKKFGPHGTDPTIAENMVANCTLVEALKGPQQVGDGNFDKAVGYAYHLDAGLFGEFMRDLALQRGVEFIPDEVVEVVQDESGAIAALRLEERGHYPIEFIVDCTGFRGLILKQTLGEPFEPYDDYLLNDRAIPVQLPHRDPTRIEPGTRATALGAGWVWRVPLYSRVGTGYVYSSKFRSEEEAKSEFFTHLRSNGDLPADAPDPEARVIKMRVGRSRRFWVKNCVAMGLASGFVEPLEATAIFSVEMAARFLVTNLPDKSCSPVLAKRYNTLMTGLFDEIRDFILTHYHTSNRPEPFWREARKESRLTESLKEKLELWRHRFPDNYDSQNFKLFDHWNYIYILCAKRFFDDIEFPLEGSVHPGHWQQFGQHLEQQKRDLLEKLPGHYELLAGIRGEVQTPALQDPPTGDQRPLFERKALQRPTIGLPIN